MFTTVGHHAFEDRREGDEGRAPFYCNREPYFGNGYYYWDDNLPFAKIWGGFRYRNKGQHYHVIESTIVCKYEDFFDLVGSRKDQKFLLEAEKLFVRKRPDKADWPVGKIIEFLKAASKDTEGVFGNRFNYKLLRGADLEFSQLSKNKKFVKNKKGYMDINPCYILCVLDKDRVVLDTKLVHSSKKSG